MVMNKMREHTKTFLIILILAFVGTIIFDWGMDVTGIKQRPNVAGEVNGVEIMYDQYYNSIRQMMDVRRQQGTEDFSDNDIAQIENQVWEGMVQEILMNQEIQKKGITVSDSEIVNIIRNNPPDFIRNIESFQTEGTFDMLKYRNALMDQNPQNTYFWLQVENELRRSIPFQKLENHISASVFVTPEETRWEYKKRNEKVKVNYIFFNPSNISDDDITLAETETEQYYNENKDDYKEPEKRQIDYILFPVVSTAYDSQAVWDDAVALMKDIKEGKDFATVAENNSEDPGSRTNGGDLGFFGKGAMVKEFEEAAFSAEVGELVGPVKSSFGLHIIKVEEKKVEDGEDKIKARHILLKYAPSNQTRGNTSTQASLFAMDALEFGYSEMAQKDSFNVESSPLFVSGGFIPGIGISRDISQFVFNGEIGNISEEPFDTDRGYVVLKITGIQKEGIKPLEDVQNTIRNTLMQEKKKELTGRHCAEIRSRITLSSDFKTITETDSTLNYVETNLISRSEYIPQVGQDPDFIGTAFGLQLNEISQPVESTRGYYLIQLVEKTTVDEANYESQKASISQELLMRKKQQAFYEWYNNVKNNAKIEDNRQRNV